MPVPIRRTIKLLSIFGIFMAAIITFYSASAQQPDTPTNQTNKKQFLPTVLSPIGVADEADDYDLVNELRAYAGVPPVHNNPLLEENCLEHARYMAENGILTHNQDPNDPYATSDGQTCARQANVWLGSGIPVTAWNRDDAIRDWMGSVPHRLWLLYPTSKEFGYGFYASQGTQHAGAAIDILSGADFSADEAYEGWPVRYPGNGEKDIPAARYPITLNWRYFGPKPVLDQVRLSTANGIPIAHAATTKLVNGHKGIKITPKNDLPSQSKIKVSVTGYYDSVPFTYSWHFYTGATTTMTGSAITTIGN